MQNNIIVVTGPTASGKTMFAAHLAYEMGTEIISADSRQVYREMNIGTGKDYEDYMVNGRQISYHLIDIKDPGYKYNLYEYQQDFSKIFQGLQDKSLIPILCGGSGLYIESVIESYQLKSVPVNVRLREELENKSQEELVAMLQSSGKSLHNTSDTLHKKRTIRAIEIALFEKTYSLNAKQTLPQLRPVIFGISIDRQIRRQKISERLKKRLENGMIEEVESLLQKLPADDLIFYGLEYKYITLYLQNKISYAEMYRQLEIAIHQFAKRQMTWFRKMERSGIQIHWIEGHLPIEEKINIALQHIAF
ncbi:MAG: tRNA (adenosine(37)-N6)-dimethylallyltransferase MiaA [Cyclobacteriaceae bacterium]|nr:tRNA (adenosine(37)-N6)-dimethylallyltransferase MiaA [Cyclobacteriaceae bacterium]